MDGTESTNGEPDTPSKLIARHTAKGERYLGSVAEQGSGVRIDQLVRALVGIGLGLDANESLGGRRYLFAIRFFKAPADVDGEIEKFVLPEEPIKAVNFDYHPRVIIARRDELFAKDATCAFCHGPIGECWRATAIFVNRTETWVLVHMGPPLRCDQDLVIAESARIHRKSEAAA